MNVKEKVKIQHVRIFEGKPEYVSPTAYANSQGISPATFVLWRRKYRKKGA